MWLTDAEEAVAAYEKAVEATPKCERAVFLSVVPSSAAMYGSAVHADASLTQVGDRQMSHAAERGGRLCLSVARPALSLALQASNGTPQSEEHPFKDFTASRKITQGGRTSKRRRRHDRCFARPLLPPLRSEVRLQTAHSRARRK
ncbi:hypothetical protein EVAR_41500_1 [Eumeta japonica]|uniref:Uncharacterized protein n=1 Tax=Eumeta variegata TaxID=151549 RepID=A0A4C1X2C1_EUMVA|nr:hypothetical protein EVAR_41500_1 [Eumeta japonica]